METSEVNHLLEGQTTFVHEKEGLKIYNVLPQEEREDSERGFRVYCIGQPADRPTKCVLLLGKTGAGKTTFINAAINHLFGVRFEDPFRLRVKEEIVDRMETESQTDFITAYTIYYKEGMKHEYNFVLIDTPGLADTRGAQQQHITKSLLEAFLTSDFGVDDLHCVGLVAKANTNRDFESERAIIGEIISLLGNSVPEITDLFATFAVDKPMVDAVVKNAQLSFKTMFGFDNGVLFTPVNPNIYSRRQLDNRSFRWDNMSEEYERYFNALVNGSSVTVEILKTRKFYDTCKKNLKAQIEKLATLATELKSNKATYDKYEEQRARNKNYMREEIVEKEFPIHLSDGVYALNCNLCRQTCMLISYNDSPSSDATKGQGVNAVKEVIIGSATSLVLSSKGREVVKEGLKSVTKLGPWGIGAVAGTVVIGGVVTGIYLLGKRTTDVDNNRVCGEKECSHTMKAHSEEKICRKNEMQEISDENMKTLYDEAVSKQNDANTKINNGQQEILSCSKNISQCVAELVIHAKKIQDLTSQDFDYITDVSSQLKNKIRLDEPLISQAIKYVDILTEVMRRLGLHTTEDVLGRGVQETREELERKLLRDHGEH